MVLQSLGEFTIEGKHHHHPELPKYLIKGLYVGFMLLEAASPFAIGNNMDIMQGKSLSGTYCTVLALSVNRNTNSMYLIELE